MKRIGSICLLALCVISLTGCTVFKKSEKKTESQSPVAEMENSFKQRWMEKRIAELSAQGQTPETARAQALEEFRVRYGFTRAAGP